ncbi:MAG: protein-glutamate O-methyltransferase CheR [Gammaproteobacteria bacterium]|nr:protein-glutamate O-methyltransferase CheR [Gammaproteobacteria bacterium]
MSTMPEGASVRVEVAQECIAQPASDSATAYGVQGRARVKGHSSITDKEFALFRDLIFEIAGIHLSDAKKALVSGRLGRRRRHHGFATFRQYHDLVTRQDQALERQIMVDHLTTNETYFFREPKHFDFLRDVLMPRFSNVPELRIWSAACSSGEEPYSIGMVLADGRTDNWRLLGTDISARVLEAARKGIYPLEDTARIPPQFLQRFCLKGIRSQAGSFMVDRAIRERIEFRPLNLNGEWPALGRFHAIFLRNVMIYFNPTTKARLVQRLIAHLEPGGFLITGHSESLNGIRTSLRMVTPSVYQLGR